jgi:hypothetical protein
MNNAVDTFSEILRKYDTVTSGGKAFRSGKFRTDASYMVVRDAPNYIGGGPGMNFGQVAEFVTA